MSLTLPEIACVIAIGVAAVQLPRRDAAHETLAATQRPLLAVRTSEPPVSQEVIRTMPRRANAATEEGLPQ
jgi:hypothetical protein